MWSDGQKQIDITKLIVGKFSSILEVSGSRPLRRDCEDPALYMNPFSRLRDLL